MKKILTIGLILASFACSAPEKLVVTNVQDLTHYPVGGSIYALPRTRLAIRMKSVSNTHIPGPYCSYAEQYLGIMNVQMLSQTNWEIAEIAIQEIIEPDPDYYYSFHSDKNNNFTQKLEELKESGFIMMPGDFVNLENLNYSIGEMAEPVHFTDLTIKKSSNTKATEKKKGKANVPAELPVIKQKSSEQERAEAAANFIVKIRKRRFKLLSGQYEVFPEGLALETSVRELNKLEQEYLALFIGKTYRDTLTKVFYYTPGNNLELEREILCRFSEETGFQDTRGTEGRPVMLEVKNLKFTANLKQVQLPSNGPNHENTFLYRIPDKAAIKIIYGSITALEAEKKICQYGATVPMQIME